MKKILLIAAFFVGSITLNAQMDPEVPCGPFDPGCDEGPPADEIPIDGGVGLLLATGALLGMKKLKENKA